jgi:crotonobetainyl-CoA:carnitine CoA-transferase CaiB-like acyl-CoA transferase
LALVVPTDTEWRRLRDLIGAAWAADPELDTTAGRLRHIDRLEARLAEWTRGQDGAPLATRLQAAGIDAAVVADLQDVLGDAQLAHRGHFAPLRHAVLGDYLVEAGGLRFGGAAPRLERPAPCLTADNTHVYCELLGMSDDEFAALSSAGVLS